MVREEREEDRLTMETLITALREVSKAGQAVPGDRYRLRPPIFEGDGDVEQFTRELASTGAPSSTSYLFDRTDKELCSRA